MHVLHRSHLSRPVAVSVAAAILAIMITVTLLAGLDAVSSNTASTSTPGPLAASAPRTVPLAPVAMTPDPLERLLSSQPALRWGTPNSVLVTRANPGRPQ
jgi:hypothetical protein